jgi:hypothetical protein
MHAHEALSQVLGYADWNTLQAQLDSSELVKAKASPYATVPVESQPAASNAGETAICGATPSPGT